MLHTPAITAQLVWPQTPLPPPSNPISTNSSPTFPPTPTAMPPAYNATTVGPAYGLFLCRRDVSANVCKECVVNATSKALLLCPDSQEALISYDDCTLSYSNKPFSSWAAATSPVLVIWSELNVSRYVEQPAQLTEVLAATLGSLVPKAANATDRFATEEGPFMANLISFTVYSLAQCRPDLSAADCNACLEEGKTQLAPSCCDAKQGGRVLYASCNMRFEM
ncbi:cysteine-rich receptor-like protein kinase 25 [Pyrus x bretschneideri]|uniref:cysteine-rich receptor-like protein kinase 25 n=1 Tax=Pyrus x bretschneideri TaxID=225117 RepID=UPI00202F393F|nr:cysteine-rich receptor-like protein kinase 25 [Pyrus x bretschneideri]